MTASFELSPLDAIHRRAGAKMVPFGGWEMPLEYTGTIDEHLACRRGVVMFDVSHLGTVRVDGDDSYVVLQRAFTNDLSKIGPGRAQYTHLLDDSDGSVLDDIIVWWLPPNGGGEAAAFDVMPNASNTERVRAAIGGRETTSERAVIAVQGPSARSTVATFWPEAAAVGRFRVAHCTWQDTSCIVAGTGYTGEDGIEVAVPADVAGSLWEALASAGAVPAGLGARDTLRLEAALPLHGHELGPGITSLQAGLGWVVAWDKGDFPGRNALAAERERGIHRHLVGISTPGRRPPRAGCPIIVDGQAAGEVTSGNYSPVLEHGIALGFVPPEVSTGDDVAIDVRGSLMPGQVVATPFVGR
ncbi:MAG TPA: glycine cleavage system aminomethyltransferase GcvT [Ilumatobacteraceae bacterium]|nr:glycine cleavage system aminomethyltransferase GcvT [Ilumatobacteraceae bacterium]